MPAITCPSCGYCHIQQAAECINCGEPLATPYLSQAPDEDVPVSSPDTDDDDEIAAYERFLAESGRESIQIRSSAEKIPMSSTPGPSAHRSRGNGLRIPQKQQPEHDSQNTPQDTQTSGGAASRQIVKRQSDHLVSNQVWRKPRAIQPYEIYETALDIMPPEVFSSLPGTHGSRSEQERQADLIDTR